jgi:hypothetical protein
LMFCAFDCSVIKTKNIINVLYVSLLSIFLIFFYFSQRYKILEILSRYIKIRLALLSNKK